MVCGKALTGRKERFCSDLPDAQRAGAQHERRMELLDTIADAVQELRQAAEGRDDTH
jgi:hypothetical protein